MRRSSRSTVNYHAPQTEPFHSASVPEAAPASSEQTRLGNEGDFPSSAPVKASASATMEDHAVPLQRGPIGTFYQPSSLHPPASNKGMNAGEKHALAAGFFVMFILAAAFGIGWWATLPPPAIASGERPTPQARSWAPAEELVTSESSGSSESVSPDNEEKATPEAMKALTVDIPAVNEISLSQPNAKENDSSGATAAPASTEKSERYGASAGRDKRAEEVSRLKSEAYSETRRDRLGRSKPAEPASREERGKPQPVSLSDSVSSNRKPDLRRALAKCKEEEGLFYRERCKWRLCNGKWGKYGCPSYGRDKREEYPLS